MTAFVRARTVANQTFVSLGYRDFRFLWAGTLLFHLGEWMEVAALLWYVQVLTGSAFQVSLVFFLRLLPMAFFSFLGGVVADRMARRNLLVVAKLASACLSLLMAALVFFQVAAFWPIVALSVLAGVVMSFYLPGRQSLVPNLVPREHLMNAISLDSGTMMASRIGGGPLVGFLLTHGGVAAVFGLRALLALAAISLLLFLPPYRPPRRQSASPWQDMKGAARYLRQERVILWLVALNIVSMLTALSLMGLLPAFTQQVLRAGGWEYGLLQMGPGLGSAISVLALAFLSSLPHRGLILFAVLIVEGVALLGFAAVTWFWLSLPLLAVVGGMNNAFRTVNTTLVQEAVPDALRGRVMSLREVATGLGPATSLLAGALAERVGPALALGAVGVAVAVVSLALLFSLPWVRRLR